MTGSRVRLRVTVFNASGLRSADWNGKSDPYVLGEIVGKPHTQFRTKTIERTLDPEWDEEKIVDDFEVGDELQLKVMDEDNKIKQAFVGDDFLGAVILPSEEFYPNGFTGELILSDDRGNGEDATLRLSIAVEDLSVQELPPYGSTYGDPASLPRDLYAGGFAPPTATLPPGAFADDHPMPPTGTLPPSTFEAGLGAYPEAAGQQASHAMFSSQVKRIRVVIISAEGLRNADWIGKSDPYCVCEVPGKPYTRFKTEVRSNTLEPVWNKQCDFDYAPGDPLEFSVFDKDIWPKSDDFLGRARLPAEHFFPNGCDLALPLDQQGSLNISVMLLGGSSPGAAAAGHHTPQPAHPPPQPQSQAPHARTPPRAEPLAPVWSGEPHRLRVNVVSARGMSLVDGGGRCDLCCACEIPRRAGSGFRTKVTSAASGNPVWNHEQEIHECFPGESLEFMIFNRAHAGGYVYAGGSEGDIVGSCVLSSEQFFHFGFDAELTIFSPGQGIRGLLRVKVTVLDRPGIESQGLHAASAHSGTGSLISDYHRISSRGHSSSAEVLPMTSTYARGTDLRPTSASRYAPRLLEPANGQGFPSTSGSDIQVLHRGEVTNLSTSRVVQPASSTMLQSSGISAARVLPGSSNLGSSSGAATVATSPLRSMVTQSASVTSVAAQQLPVTTAPRSTSLTSATSVPMSSLSSNSSAAMAVARSHLPVGGSLNGLSTQAASGYVHQQGRPLNRDDIVASNLATYSLPIAEQGTALGTAGSTYSGSMGAYGASLGKLQALPRTVPADTTPRALPRTVPIDTTPRPMTSIPIRLL